MSRKVTMQPPEGEALYRRFTLSSGRSYRPDFVKGGIVKVNTEAEARELEREGWSRQQSATKSLETEAAEAGLRRWLANAG